MKRHTSGTLLLVGLFAMGITGCSLPGMSYSAPPTQGSASNKHGRYLVQPITPKLVETEARARKKDYVGKSNPKLATAISNYSYKVEPQDVIQVTVWGHPEFSPDGSALKSLGPPGQSQLGTSISTGGDQSNGVAGFTVQSNGTIFFPYVGSIKVQGLTTDEIRQKLTQALKPYIKDPQVGVNVVGFHSQTYQLSGAVVKPGLYPITNVPVTVSQAIAAAGGIIHQVPNTITTGNTIPRPLADLARVIYIHDGKRSVLNLRAFFKNGDQLQNRLLHPGDIIEVPDNSFEQIHMIGEVRQPGNYPLDNGHLNLAQALGDAGGLNLDTANPSRIFVFRGAYEEPHIFWLNASSPEAMLLATQFELKPQDVIYVATAGISTWNRIISQILPTVQTLYETKVLLNR